MKRILAVLLCALMLAGVLPMGVVAEELPAASAETELPEQIGSEPAGETEYNLLVDKPKITGATMTVSPTAQTEIFEPVTLEVNSVTYVDPSLVDDEKTVYAWYKKPASGSDVKIGTTYGYENTFTIKPGLADNTAKFYCQITAYSDGGASDPFKTSTVTVNVGPAVKTSDIGATGAADLNAIIADAAAAGGTAITITVDNTVTLKAAVTVPKNVKIIVSGSGELVVSVTGGRLVNNGTLQVNSNGTFSCPNDSFYSGNPIIAQDDTAIIIPTTLPHQVKTIPVEVVSNLSVGVKVPRESDPTGYRYVAAPGIPAKMSYDYTPFNAGKFSLKVVSDLDGTLTPDSEGCITLTKTGKHTITVTPTVAGGVGDECTVYVEDYKLRVIDSNDAEHQHYLYSGGKLDITVQIKPGNVNGTSLLTPTLSTADQQYASLTWSGSGDTYHIFVTAKEVTDRHKVTVHIELEDHSLSTDWEVQIYPAPADIRAIWESPSGDIDVTGEMMVYDIDDNAFPGFTFRADVLPAKADQVIHWTYTDSNKTAKVQITDNDTNHAKVHVSASNAGTEGYVTLTGTGYSGVSIGITVRMVKLDTSVKIDVPSEGFLTVRAGSKLQCSATLGTALTGKLKWSSDPAETAWGTIDEKTGVFTATTHADAQQDVEEVEISVTLNINEQDVATDKVIVKVVPSAKKAFIKMNTETFQPTDTIRLNAGEGNSWTLNGFFTPDANNFTVQLLDPQYRIPSTWTCSDPAILSVTPSKLDPDEAVISTVSTGGTVATGTVTLTFAANDGSGVKTSVKVNVSTQVGAITLWSDAEYTQKQPDLVSGKTLQLYAKIEPAAALDQKLKYEVINCDSNFVENPADKGEYATVSASGKVTAKTVFADHFVIIRATSTDGGYVAGDYHLRILPKTEGNLLILNADDGNRDVTGTTVKLDMLYTDKLQLAVPYPEDASFSSSHPGYLKVDPSSGLCTVKVSDINKAVTVTITATDNTNPVRKATVKVLLTKLVQPGGITVTSKSGVYTVSAGQKLAMSAAVSSKALNKKVVWSLDKNDAPFASITSGGVVKTKKTASQVVDITVIATAADGSGVSGTCKVTVVPKASQVVISDGTEYITGQTLSLNYDEAPFTLDAEVCYPDGSKSYDVTWKSSSTKVAKVDSFGTVTLTGKTGKAVITATATDGSKKSAKVTVQVMQLVENYKLDYKGLTVEGGRYLVGGGSTTQLKVVFTSPAKPTNKKVKWEIKDPAHRVYASVTASGKLKTVKVTEVQKITVRCIPLDDPKETHAQDFLFVIKPKVSGITLKMGTVNVTGTTQEVAVGTYQIDVTVFPGDASQSVTWKSNNKKYVEFPAPGKVKFTKPGKYTITVTANDGSKTKSKVKFIVT